MKKLLTTVLTTATLVSAAILTWHGEAAKAAGGAADCDKIIYMSTRNGGASYDIVLMNTDGSQKTGLLPGNLSGGNPKVSADGTKVLFVSSVTQFGMNLYVMNTDGSGITQLTNAGTDDFWANSFSPDGTKVLFLRRPAGNESTQIYTINIDGTGLTRLNADSQIDNDPIFSPDGTKIIFVRNVYFANQFISSELFSMNANGTDVQALTNMSGYAAKPQFNPDGSKILFASKGSNDQWRLEIINANGTNRTTLVDGLPFLPDADFNPAGNKIVFQSAAVGNNEIYSINSDGTNLTNLSNNPGDDSRPVFSLDGSKIVFISDRNNSNVYEVFIMNHDGTNQINLSNRQGSFADYYPRAVFIDPDRDGIGAGCDNCPAAANADQQNTDNDSLGDVCDPDDDNDGVADGSDNCPLNVNPSQLDTDSDTQGNACDADDDNDGVIDAGDNCPLAANQYRFAFSSAAFTPTNPEIYTQNFDGTNRVRLTVNSLVDANPNFNRTGTQIVWESNRLNSRYEIFKMNADGSGTVRLTNIAGNNLFPTFSPDGLKIAFESRRTGQRNVFVMNADGSNQMQITNITQSLNSASNPNFNQDGTRIAFDSQRGSIGNATWDIYSIKIDGTDEVRLTTATGQDQYPSYSPDGSKIVFVSRRDGDSAGGEIYLMNADGTNQTRLTNNTTADIEPTFTPDGSRIVYTNAGNASLMTMKTDGTDARLLAGGGGSHPSVAPQPDSDGDGTGDVCDTSFNANTPAGANVAVQAPNGSVSFSNVSQAGATSFVSITPNQNQMPQGYTLCPTCPAYDITTTAAFTPPITVCLAVPAAVTAPDFLLLNLMHGENGVFVNRTTNRLTAQNGQRSVCGVVSSLSPFALAVNRAPTAAPVSVSGRVFSGKDAGIIRRVRISLMDTSTGTERTTQTNPFGFYRFDELEIGRVYIVRAESSKYLFTPDNHFLNLLEDRENVDFTGSRNLFQTPNN